MMRPGLPILAVALLLGTAAVGADEPTPEALEFFEKKIRPILVDNCHRCHSAGKKQEAHLFLDSREGLLKGGDSGPVVVPGRPERSRLIEAVGYANVKLQMPPKGKLTDDQIADLRIWVRMGAPWTSTTSTKLSGAGNGFDLQERKKHWAFQPVRTAVLPAVQRTDWMRSPIDAFLLAALEAKGLKPASPADKRTLLRRVTYDLTGLPPTTSEIDAFLADDSPTAFARVVDRLLASPRYGERWGRHWLDLVRFAETMGHEFDYEIPLAYQYRDYVIRAFNDDLPYDRFVIEHIAGDLIKDPRRHPIEGTNESILATGFWFLGETKHSPVDIRGDEADRIDNQIDVFGKAFLGLTVACARCHDHKFDAIATKDYYALAGYLQSSRYQLAFIDPPERNGKTSARLRELQGEGQELVRSTTGQLLSRQVDKLARHLAGEGKRDQARERWKNRATVPALDGNAVVFEEFTKKNYEGWFVTGDAFGASPTTEALAALQMDPRRPLNGVFGPGVAHSGQASSRLQGTLRSQTFDITKKRMHFHVAGRQAVVRLIIDGYQLIREPIYGGLQIAVEHGDRLEWRSMDVSMWQGHRAYIEILDAGAGYVALDQIVFADDGPPRMKPNPLLQQVLDAPESETAEGLIKKTQGLLQEIVDQWRNGKLASAPNAAERVALLNWLLQEANTEWSAEDSAKAKSWLDRLREAEAALLTPRLAIALADGTGENEHVHIRGSHKNLGDPVPRRLLEAIAGPKQPAPASGSGRLDLATRLVDPSNPFLARVLVNRLWRHHFGEGLVRSVDNFGILGEKPTHPELLDFLAAEFVRGGWSMKRMHRLMLLSSAYQMASVGDDRRAKDIDPQNRLLHRMPVRRLEAEAIRDAMLSASGRLDQRMYGPGVLPHLTPYMQGRGKPPTSGPLDGDGRRSLYINVRRNFLTPMFLAFDYPIPFTAIGRRTESNVPAQALTLMNNPFVLQQADLWGQRVARLNGVSDRQRIQHMYLAAFGRMPTKAEWEDALDFVENQGKHYGDPADPRAWGDLAHVLFNVKEFIFVN